jgi:SPP1 family predicted phage head-tail adaptor
MLFRDVVDLIAVTEADDGGGGIVETETSREVFANKKSIRQSEFYQAHAAGLKPTIMFIVRSIDYEDESRLTYEGKAYEIIRSYSKNDELIELICSLEVGHG